MFGGAYFGQVYPAGVPAVYGAVAAAPVAGMGDVFTASLAASQNGVSMTSSRTTVFLASSRNTTSLTGSRHYAVIPASDSEAE